MGTHEKTVRYLVSYASQPTAGWSISHVMYLTETELHNIRNSINGKYAYWGIRRIPEGVYDHFYQIGKKKRAGPQ